MSETILCKACKEELPVSNFYFRKDIGKYRNCCKQCKRINTKEEIIKRLDSDTKKCKHCGVDKHKSEYNKAGGGKWLQPYCKQCDKIRKQKHKEKNLERVKKKEHENYLKRRKLVPPHIKKQNEIIRIENLKKASKKYLESLPKLTEEQKKQRRYESGKRYREKNKDKILNNKNKYIRSKEGKIKAAEWQSKMMSNIGFRINKNLRGRVYVALKRGCKSDTTMNLLGCTIDEFKMYFESLFTDGMSWEKYMEGGIHIDHIKPCISFDLTKEEEQRKCFHYTNLQPLWAIDNLKKGTKIYE